MKFNTLVEKILLEADPKKGTGKKPKGSGRRLYTDENPKKKKSLRSAFKYISKKKEASKKKTQRMREND